MCDKPLSSKMFPSLLITEADEIREASRSFCGLPYPGDSASFNRPFLSLDKLVSQFPSLVLRWQVGSLHKPPHSMRGCLTPDRHKLPGKSPYVYYSCQKSRQVLHCLNP